MSGARSITAYLIDLSPSMGEKTTIKETVYREDEHRYEEEDRQVSLVELAGELVCLKIKEAIFGGLKTNRSTIFTFGSPRTNNLTNKEQGGYEGIDMIWPTNPPNLDTIDLVRKLRATKPGQAEKKADPLDALVVAISTILNPEHNGIGTLQRNTWTRNIYLITDASETMDISEVDKIKSALEEHKIGLKIVGVNFDDDLVNYVQKNKPAIKRENEKFWHEFLDGVPEAGVASLDYVFQDNLRPEVKLTASQMLKSTLSFGNPDNAYSEDASEEASKLINIDIKVGKMTSIARPITQRKISCVAQLNPLIQRVEAGFARAQAHVSGQPSSAPELPDYSRLAEAMRNAAAEGAEVEEVNRAPSHIKAPTYAIKNRKVFFYKDDLEGIGSEKQEKRGAEPISGAIRIELPDGKHQLQLVDEDESTFIRGWKLGQTLIPIDENLYTDLATKKGIEIIGFSKKGHVVPPYLKFGEVYYVEADGKDFEAQIQLGALVRAMIQLKRWAIVRWVKKDNYPPLIGALSPVSTENVDFFQLVALPYTNDVRAWSFPPLTRVINKLGETIFDHVSLPTERMEALTDRLVDSMKLVDIKDAEDDEPYEFGAPDDILNPYIHRLKQDVVNRTMHPDRPILAPHEELTRSFHPPPSVLEAMAEVKDLLEHEGFLPTHRGRENVKTKKRVRDETQKNKDKEEKKDDGEEVGGTGVVVDRDFAHEASTSAVKTEDTPPRKKVRAEPDLGDNESDRTESEHMSEGGGDAREEIAGAVREKIGISSPVSDFNRELDAAMEHSGLDDGDGGEGTGDSIISVMKSMEKIIRRLTVSADGDASRLDHQKARECVRAYRQAAVKWDESERYNQFIREFKEELTGSQHEAIREFWAKFLQNAADCGLITAEEDLGGEVKVTQAEARKFIGS
ncbi:hypothetical protein A4X06_0g2844 [Tilletia controversa]|uniref:ATP-dependent DNA helicase II subunit 2 n=1 Tax=Tilletia controversa TaxID=13291 RepID=A0A8X7SYI4_9BASI|nr:hypothetical protein CF328_g4243 [Tilletia controversa]KAE8251028.1 hypothetical protein A4X06_0g2844 [Tilletia controversa]CAD6975968.1 unnamed protein product [Tilletia controversa]